MKQKKQTKVLHTGHDSDCTEKILSEAATRRAWRRLEVAAAFSKRRPEK